MLLKNINIFKNIYHNQQSMIVYFMLNLKIIPVIVQLKHTSNIFENL